MTDPVERGEEELISLQIKCNVLEMELRSTYAVYNGVKSQLTHALAEKERDRKFYEEKQKATEKGWVKEAQDLQARLDRVVEAGKIRTHAGYHVAGEKWVSCTDEGMCGCGMDQHNATLQRVASEDVSPRRSSDEMV